MNVAGYQERLLSIKLVAVENMERKISQVFAAASAVANIQCLAYTESSFNKVGEGRGYS